MILQIHPFFLVWENPQNLRPLKFNNGTPKISNYFQKFSPFSNGLFSGFILIGTTWIYQKRNKS